jgi:hypothetical protein
MQRRADGQRVRIDPSSFEDRAPFAEYFAAIAARLFLGLGGL